MPNPGAFGGSRKEFLLGEKEAYKLGVDGNYSAEALALIYRRYFKRYPIDLPHNTEPTAEALAAVDDNAPDVEVPEPDIFALSREDYDEAMLRVKRRKKDIEYRKGQIKRWMAYQYMKDHHVDPKATGVDNPYRLLLCKLTNRPVNRPRRKTPVNVWRKNKRSVIDLELKRNHGREVGKEKLAALRDKIAREMFATMDEKIRHDWEMLAIEEHRVAVDQWNRDMEAPPSTHPEDRQRAIQGLVSFVQPILDMICEATGWKASLIAGGPEPAQEGQLNVISIHSGSTPGDVKMMFGHAERANIKKYLVPMFGAFLQKCYSPEECRARALSSQEGHLHVSQLDIENANITIHTIHRKSASNKTINNTNPSNPEPGSSQAEGIIKPSSGTDPSSGANPSPPVIRESPPINVSVSVNPSPTTNDPSPITRPAPTCSSAGHPIVTPNAPGQEAVAGSNTAVHLTSVADKILEAEADTLNRLAAPPEDEIDMVSSRCPSPAPTTPQISPAPSPPPSRPMSPIEAIPSNDEPIASAQTTAADTPSFSISALPADDGIVDHGNDVGGNTGPSSGRPRRNVKKTTKLILMEEAGSRRGKKRKSVVLEDAESIINQEPAVKRARAGRKVKGGK